MVRVMPTEPKIAETQSASTIVAPRQETIVLTACMRSKDVREDVLPMLLEDGFVKSDHRALFRAIRAMHEANYPIDDVSLLDYLRSNRELDAVGGEQAVERMFESDMPLLSWQTAYDELIDASRRRSLVTAMNEIEAEAYETPTDMKAFVSLEMSGKELAQRIICAESGVSISHFRMGTIPKASWDAIAAACCDIPGNGIEIEDKASVTLGDIRATAARMMRGAERGLIVIDYLQLISSATDGARFQNRAVEVGEISRRLKVLAKELGVPVVTLAQLSRQAESHPGLPRLSDLRESGSIEQDADTVLFLSRDPDEITDEKSGSRQVILSVAKNRSGPTGEIDMLFVPTSTKFYEVGPRKETSDE